MVDHPGGAVPDRAYVARHLVDRGGCGGALLRRLLCERRQLVGVGLELAHDVVDGGERRVQRRRHLADLVVAAVLEAWSEVALGDALEDLGGLADAAHESPGQPHAEQHDAEPDRDDDPQQHLDLVPGVGGRGLARRAASLVICWRRPSAVCGDRGLGLLQRGHVLELQCRHARVGHGQVQAEQVVLEPDERAVGLHELGVERAGGGGEMAAPERDQRVRGRLGRVDHLREQRVVAPVDQQAAAEHLAHEERHLGVADLDDALQVLPRGPFVVVVRRRDQVAADEPHCHRRDGGDEEPRDDLDPESGLHAGS